MMSHEPRSIISLTEAMKSQADQSYLGVLSVSVAGGNEAVLSCRPGLVLLQLGRQIGKCLQRYGKEAALQTAGNDVLSHTTPYG